MLINTDLSDILITTLKQKVYSTEVTSYEDLMQRIKNAVIEMQQDTETLHRGINSVFHRCLEACIRAEGHHFEMRL